MKRTVIALAALAAILSSCGGEKGGLLHDLFDIEARSMKDAPPSTVEGYKAAIEEYGQAVEDTAAAMDKVAMYWRLLAVKYLEMGMYGESYRTALKALEYYPDDSGLYYTAGVSAAHLAKAGAAEQGGGSRDSWLAVAESSYKRSLELYDLNARSLYGLAVLYSYELGRYAEAVPLTEKYLTTRSKDVDALFMLARSLYGAGRGDEALTVYDRILDVATLDKQKEQAAANKAAIMGELYGR